MDEKKRERRKMHREQKTCIEKKQCLILEVLLIPVEKYLEPSGTSMMEHFC